MSPRSELMQSRRNTLPSTSTMGTTTVVMIALALIVHSSSSTQIITHPPNDPLAPKLLLQAAQQQQAQVAALAAAQVVGSLKLSSGAQASIAQTPITQQTQQPAPMSMQQSNLPSSKLPNINLYANKNEIKKLLGKFHLDDKQIFFQTNFEHFYFTCVASVNCRVD